MIEPGDDLATLVLNSLGRSGIELVDGDILVVAQKIVSKAEGRQVDLRQVQPSANAVKLAQLTGKDPRQVELVIQESRQVLRSGPGTIFVYHSYDRH